VPASYRPITEPRAQVGRRRVRHLVSRLLMCCLAHRLTFPLSGAADLGSPASGSGWADLDMGDVLADVHALAGDEPAQGAHTTI